MLTTTVVTVAALLSHSATAQEWPVPGDHAPDVTPDTLIEWDIPRGSIEEAAKHFSERIGQQVSVNVDPGTSLVPIGPFRGPMTPRQMWSVLMDAGCAEGTVTKTGSTYSSIPKPIPGLNDRKWDYDLPRSRLVDMLHHVSRASGRFLIGFMSTDLEEQETLVGPFKGRMTVHEIMLRVLAPVPHLTVRWVDQSMLSVEPRPRVPYQDDLIARGAAGELCRVRIPPSSRDRLLVVASRLPSIGDGGAPVTVIDRRRIDETGANSISDVLRNVSQTAFHRDLGFNPSGAQFAELRGIGAQYTLVLLNGRRTFGSAVDLTKGGFDLNVVPLSAVERIEIMFDSPSLMHGADAIGGTVNIVLRRGASETADVRHQGASGGAATRRGSINAGIETDNSNGSLFLDYSHTTPLLGIERDRWRNQDFRRYGGIDYRSPYSAPPNVRSMDGENLPGLTSSSAAVVISNSGTPAFLPGENLTSLQSWQSVIPEIRRMTVAATGDHRLGRAVLRSEVLFSDRDSSFQYGPAIVPGFVLGAEHPQNPFGVPVSVSAALTGLPSLQQDIQSSLLRGVLQVDGTVSKLKYEVYALHSEDRARSTFRHEIDVAKVIDSLSGIGHTSLDVLSNAPGDGGQAFVLSAPSASHYLNGGTQISGRLSGDVLRVRGRDLFAVAGFEARREFADIDPRIGNVSRNVTAAYSRVEIPIAPGVVASAGIRRDHFDNLAPITNMQYFAKWRPSSLVKFHASYSDNFHAPQLTDLYFPRVAIPFQVYDSRRTELAPIAMLTGGNKGLRPATGRSVSLGFLLGNDEASRLSVNLWSIEMRDRISAVFPHALLSNEDTAIPGRIIRELPSVDDIAANRPGRLISLDVSRANLGSTETKGVDLSVETSIDAGTAILRPRFDATYTDEFRFSDTPSVSSLAVDRAGVASELGTISRWRFRGSLTYEHDKGITASAVVRSDACYDDFIASLGQTGRVVCPRVVLDANVSARLPKNVKLTFGASDIFNNPPPYAAVNGPYGYDRSQGDLVGRTLFLGISGTLD